MDTKHRSQTGASKRICMDTPTLALVCDQCLSLNPIQYVTDGIIYNLLPNAGAGLRPAPRP